jgi:hypothetical protein
LQKYDQICHPALWLLYPVLAAFCGQNWWEAKVSVARFLNEKPLLSDLNKVEQGRLCLNSKKWHPLHRKSMACAVSCWDNSTSSENNENEGISKYIQL